jgi:hypothetical protein
LFYWQQKQIVARCCRVLGKLIISFCYGNVIIAIWGIFLAKYTKYHNTECFKDTFSVLWYCEVAGRNYV